MRAYHNPVTGQRAIINSDKVISSVADSEIAKQAERTLLAKLQELEKEYLKQEEQP